MSSLDIVIVNWNAGRQLYDCIRSIAETRQEGVAIERVVVVDNASTDGSASGLEMPGVPLHVLRNEQNLGFAAGCNQGARGSRADYLLFLNPDTELHDGSLSIPVRYLDDPAHADVGIAGVQLLDEAGDVARTCARFPTPGRAIGMMAGLERIAPGLVPGHFMDDWDHGDTRAVDQVMGAFFLTRRPLFEQLGGFDERFFVYLEEVDYSFRAKQAGWATHFVADAQVFHRGCGTTQEIRDVRLFYILRSRALYFFKHASPLQAGTYFGAMLTVECAARLAQALAHRSAAAMRETLSGYQMLWRDVPRILATARYADRGGASSTD